MAEMKTRATEASVDEFLNRVGNARRREDGWTLLRMYKAVTRKTPTMWGPSIVGFGTYRYRYASGREGEICMAGFSPRSGALVLYLMDFAGRAALLKKLGKHKTGKGCLYINGLEDVDTGVLRQLIAGSYAQARRESV